MKLKCLSCGKIIEGDKRGSMIECGCANHVWIDETEFYVRAGAMNLDLIEEIKED